MKRIKRPLAGLALLGAASVAVVAAATVWLYTGWTTIGLTLTDRIGVSTQALQGFTLEGEAGWTRAYDSLHFRLEDGILHTGFVLDEQYQTDLYTITDTQIMALQPESRQAVDREAVVTHTDANGVQYVEAATRFLRRMYTLRFPDGTAIRLAGEDVALEQPVIVWAQTSGVGELDNSYDYYWNGDTANERDSVQFNDPRSPCYPYIVPLGGDYGVCWRQTQAGYRPGLYRAHGLTEAEIAALPRDGTVQGTEVLCASTEFGTLTPFYCPADAKTALAGAAMEDGFTLLLYLDGDGTLWADLVTAAGLRADHRELGTLPAADLYDATLQPRTTTREAVVSVLCNQAVEGGGYIGNGGVLAALRVENGRFTVAQALENDGAGADAAVLNEAGDAVLTARRVSNAFEYWEGGIAEISSRVELAAYDLATGHMTYSGILNTGHSPYWEPDAQKGSSVRYDFSAQPSQEEATP